MYFKKKKILLIILLFILLLISFFIKKKNINNNYNNKKIKILTTVYPIYDFTKNIVNNNFIVEQLIPKGVCIHDFEPSIKDIKKIINSDVLIFSNKNIEKWIIKFILKDNKIKNKILIIEAGKKIKIIKNLNKKKINFNNIETKKVNDFHIWLDINNALIQVDEIFKKLILKYPNYKKNIYLNFNKYKKKLNNLNQDYNLFFKKLKKKKILFQYPIFIYLLERYNINYNYIFINSHFQDISIKYLITIKKYIKKNNINIIYCSDINMLKFLNSLFFLKNNIKIKILYSLENINKYDIIKKRDYIFFMRKNLEMLKIIIKK